MALRRELIPGNILDAAKKAGLKLPDGYIGRSNGHHAHKREETVESIIQDVETASETAEACESEEDVDGS